MSQTLIREPLLCGSAKRTLGNDVERGQIDVERDGDDTVEPVLERCFRRLQELREPGQAAGTLERTP